jgi:hypothetical protein
MKVINLFKSIFKWLIGDKSPPICKICNDRGYHECNIWYDEIIIVDCEYCKLYQNEITKT